MILGIMARDESMMAYIVERYSKLLWSVVAPVLGGIGNEQDMEECVADVFIHLWTKPENYKPEKGKLSSYLSVMARTKAIDRYRMIYRKLEDPLEETAMQRLMADCLSQPLESLLQKERREDILSVIARLGEPMEEIVIRRFFYDQKPRMIAAAMNLSVKQVENSLYTAKRQLRQMLENRKENA